MKFELVEDLAEVLSRSSLYELEYISKGNRIHITRSSRSAVFKNELSKLIESNLNTSVETLPHTVVAGIGGVFYRAPAPGEAPFIQEGEAVSKGQKIGIVEAMKTLIVLESDQKGIVSRVLVEDGAVVTAGTAILEIKAEVSPSV